MPTVFAHALVGASLSPLAPPGLSRRKLAVTLVVLAMLPDADVLAFAFDIPYGQPFGHRGFSHSLLFAALAGLAATTLGFRKLPRFGAAWWRVCALAALATASHGVLDACTDAGLGVGFFLPFDETRTFLPWRPLATSPIGLASFVRHGGAEVLTSELLWVGLPCATWLLVQLGARRFLRRR